VASAGDAGYGTLWPAEYPTVVAAGGTTLRRRHDKRGWGEVGWVGSGSGCTTFPKPAWQTDRHCAFRTENDVAATADPQFGVAAYDTYFGVGWYVLGGTSVASPLIASAYALAGNAAQLNYGESLYADPAGFHDVTFGRNGICKPAYLCEAGRGYDGPTGNGTPNGIGAF
jgi:subtilase family serine protease